MKVSVVIPVYNEKSTIATVIERVRAVPLEKEIIVVDDCSTDGSKEVLESLVGNDLQLHRHERNLGKGAALSTGFRQVTGDIVIIQDADLEYDPQEYPKLVKPIVDGKADVVYGSRFAGGDYHRVLFFWHMVGNKLLTLLSNMMTDLNLTDMETGYKVFTGAVIKNLVIQERRFGVEPEITAKLARMKLRIYEVGISYSGRGYKEGKKVNWRDGISALRCIVRYNLWR